MFRGRVSLARVGLAGAVVVALVGTALVASFGIASATGGCGSTPGDGNVYINCVVPSASSPYATYTDGQQVDLSMGAADPAIFSDSDGHGGAIEAIECEYNNGTGGLGDPPSDTYCDAQTAASDWPLTVNSDGSWDYAAQEQGDLVPVYAVPGSNFQGAAITCNASNPCVFYVGEDYTNFSAPHVFSNPFLVGATAPNMASTGSASVTVGSNLSYQASATGNPTPTYSDTAFAGCTPSTLPSGVTLNSSSGLLSGTPADHTPGSYTVCIVATNGAAPNADQDVSLTVDTASLTVTASSATMTQGGPVPAITAGYTGFVNGDTATSLSTAPACSTTATSGSATGTYPSSCSSAVDSTYTIHYVNGSVTVNPSFYISTTQSAFTNDPATDGSPYDVALTTTGADGPVKWKLTTPASSLPKGLKVHPGAVSGTPKSGKHADPVGPYTFTVSATVKKSKTHPAQTATATFTITVG